jgi:hypothetical protein
VHRTGILVTVIYENLECAYPLPKYQKITIILTRFVFGLVAKKIEFDRIEFERIEFG